jgi:hypothetical protein
MQARVKLSGRKDTDIIGGRDDRTPFHPIVAPPTAPELLTDVTTTAGVGKSEILGLSNVIFFGLGIFGVLGFQQMKRRV